MKKTPLAKLSPHRRKQVNKYLKMRRVFLEENPMCQVCLSNKADQIHHKKRRDNDHLLDAFYFLACCQPCHTRIHNNPAWARDEGYLIDRLAL